MKYSIGGKAVTDEVKNNKGDDEMTQASKREIQMTDAEMRDFVERHRYSEIGSYECRNGEYYQTINMIEITNPYTPSGMTKVQALNCVDAKAAISKEYGFEFNSIKVEGVCWYDATDYNHFRFSVRGWQYEANDYNFLTVLNTVENANPAVIATLSGTEAKAAIAEKYGFEFNLIKIKAIESNTIRFSIGNSWHYEVKNFGALNWPSSV
jgi:hypothetical protein